MNRKYTLVLALVVGSLISRYIFAEESKQPLYASDSYIEILRDIGSKRYSEAIAKCKQMIEKYPNFDRPYQKLVVASDRSGVIDSAAIYFQFFTKNNPENAYAHYGLGLVRSKEKQYEEAIQELKRCIAIAPEFVGGYTSIVDVFLEKTHEKAELYLDSVCKTRPQSAIPFYALGYFYYSKNDYSKTLEMAEKAVVLDSTFGRAYHLIGNARYCISEFTEAIRAYEISLEMRKNDLEAKASLFNAIGGGYYSLCSYEKALEYFPEALQIAKEVGNRVIEGYSLRYIGAIYFSLGDWEKALEHVICELAIAEEIDNKTLEEDALDCIGTIHSALGNHEKALEYFTQALKIAEEIDNRRGKATILVHTGGAYYVRGNHEKALEYFVQVLRLAKEIGNREIEGYSLQCIGMVYYTLSEYEKGVEYFAQALEISQKINDKVGEINSLRLISDVYRVFGSYKDALEYSTKALKLAKEIKQKPLEVHSLMSMSEIYDALGNYEEALEYSTKTLKLAKEIKDSESEGSALQRMGIVYSNLDRHDLALEHLRNALNIFCEIDAKGHLLTAQSYIAELLEKKENYREALVVHEKTIEITEELRSNMRVEELKTSFLSGRVDPYRGLIRCYLEVDSIKDAFDYAERMRSRTLLDMLSHPRVDINKGISPELKEEKEGLERHLKTLFARLRIADKRKRECEDKEKKKELQAQVDSLKKEIRIQKNEYEDLLTELKLKNPEYASLQSYKEPLALSEVQNKVLRDGEVLLEYFLSEKKSAVWVVKKDTFHLLYLETTDSLVSEQITRLRKSFPFGSEVKGICSNLYETLFKPVEKYVDDAEVVYIVPDGALHKIPFGMFYDKEQDKYLLERYPFAYIQSASVLDAIRSSPKKKAPEGKLLAFGDPIFSEEQMEGEIQIAENITREGFANKGFAFNPLPYTRKEVEAIANIMKVELEPPYVNLGIEANESTIKSLSLEDYRYIHFATHGYLVDAQNPIIQPSLVLSLVGEQEEDGFLQMGEIFNLNLNADMVVLSGCETGMGKEVKGEGIVGLTRAFMYAGTPSVVVSLWSVQDLATALLMRDFYKNLQEGMNKAEALRQAKMSLIEEEGYILPFYWAPFILVGEWK